MTGTTAEAYLYDCLMEPLRGCKSLNVYRYTLMKRVLAMSDLRFQNNWSTYKVFINR